MGERGKNEGSLKSGWLAKEVVRLRAETARLRTRNSRLTTEKTQLVEALEGAEPARSIMARLDALRAFCAKECGPDYSEIDRVTEDIHRIKAALTAAKGSGA